MKISRSNQSIVTFLLIAFICPLFCSLVLLKITVFHPPFFKFIILGIQAMSPTLAALITVLFYSKTMGLKDFLKRKFFSLVNYKVLLIAFFIPFIIIFLTIIISTLFLKTSFELNKLSAAKLGIIVWALVAEELGWRGFLHEAFDEKFKWFLTPLLIGLIWASWHYHFFILNGIDVPFILFVLECIGHSYIYYFITKLSNGNVIPASFFHFSGNLFFNIFLLGPKYHNGNVIPYVLYIIISFIVAFIFYYTKGDKLGIFKQPFLYRLKCRR